VDGLDERPRLHRLSHHCDLHPPAGYDGVMNTPLKHILRIGGVVVGLGAAIWAMRDKLLPAPEIPDGPPPRFRTGNATGATGDGLTSIKGIGPVYAERLEQAGIASLPELAAADVAEVSAAAGVSESTATSWMEQAAATS